MKNYRSGIFNNFIGQKCSFGCSISSCRYQEESHRRQIGILISTYSSFYSPTHYFSSDNILDCARNNFIQIGSAKPTCKSCRL